MHLRRAILEFHRSQLKAISSNNAWITRGLPPRIGNPSFTLHDENEESQVLVFCQPIGQRQQSRKMLMIVTGWTTYEVNDPEKAEAKMDDLALKMEQTLAKHAKADDMQLLGTEKTLDEDDPRISSVSLRYEISYRSTESNPV